MIKCYKADGRPCHQKDCQECRIAELEAENRALRAGRAGESLLKKAGNRPPKGCYCKSGKCMAPKPEWCKDAKKRDALQPPNGGQQ